MAATFFSSCLLKSKPSDIGGQRQFFFGDLEGLKSFGICFDVFALQLIRINKIKNRRSNKDVEKSI